MSEARAKVTQALDDLVANGCVVAGLVGRDGLPVLLRSRRPVQEETFCAMGAALLAAAEAALQELAEVRPALAMVEAGEPIDQNYIERGDWEVEIAGKAYPAIASIRPLYDPEMKRVRG